MGFNEESAVRAACGMGTTTPSADTITAWQTLIDGIIDSEFSDASTDIKKVIEMNRLETMWERYKKKNSEGTLSTTKLLEPLSDKEKLMLGGSDDSMVDSIPMNGKRISDII